MKIERRVSLLIVDVQADNSREGLDAFTNAMQLARDAIAAGESIDQKTTTPTGMTRVRVEIENQ